MVNTDTNKTKEMVSCEVTIEKKKWKRFNAKNATLLSQEIWLFFKRDNRIVFFHSTILHIPIKNQW